MKFSRQAWARLIREMATEPGGPCFVCGENRHITHVHHVIPVSQMAHLLTLAEADFLDCSALKAPYVWLCPNHHAIWHRLEGKDSRVASDLFGMLSPEEREAYGRLNDIENEEWARFNAFLAQRKDQENERQF